MSTEFNSDLKSLETTTNDGSDDLAPETTTNDRLDDLFPEMTSNDGSDDLFTETTSNDLFPETTTNDGSSDLFPETTSNDGSSDLFPKTTTNGGSDDQSPETTTNGGSDDLFPETTSNDGSDDLSPETTTNGGSDDQSPETTTNDGSDELSLEMTTNDGSSDLSPETTTNDGSDELSLEMTTNDGLSDRSPETTTNDESPETTTNEELDDLFSETTTNEASDDLFPDKASDDLSPDKASDDLSPDKASDDLSPDKASDDLSPDKASDDLSQETTTNEASDDLSPDKASDDLSQETTTNEASSKDFITEDSMLQQRYIEPEEPAFLPEGFIEPSTLVDATRLIRANRERLFDAEEIEPEIDFVYADSENFREEISQLYSLNEQDDNFFCYKSFRGVLQDRYSQKWVDNNEKLHVVKWANLSENEQKTTIHVLLNDMDNAYYQKRLLALQSLLYIAQGCWKECTNLEQAWTCIRNNSLILVREGAYHVLAEHLAHISEYETIQCRDNERERFEGRVDDEANNTSNPEVKCCLNILYHIVEVCRTVDHDTASQFEIETSEILIQSLSEPISGSENILSVVIFSMLLRFCNGSAPRFPIMKIIVLLWKVLLSTLGGTEHLVEIRKNSRQKAGLEPDFDSKEATQSLSQLVLKPSNFEMKNSSTREIENEDFVNTNAVSKLKPKVRHTEVDSFVDMVQSKYVGFRPVEAHRTGILLSDLPDAIHESLKVLEDHVYLPLSELQMEKEKILFLKPKLNNFSNIIKQSTPYCKQKIDFNNLNFLEPNPTEQLYQQILPNIPQFMIALLKILLAATPTKNKTDALNIYIDVCPNELERSNMTMFEKKKVELDMNRYTEIIVKAVSSILFLLLKHFKLNHIYQFEFICHHLVFANCIPLILKFFNQPLAPFIHARNYLPSCEFPSCLIQTPQSGDDPRDAVIDQKDITCWKNLFSCINLLRVLQKLTKWKPSRTMVLVAFKSVQILRKLLKINQSQIKIYTLKLLKMQTRYLGRNWRRSNMRIMSAIYKYVRHRLHDDWSYGNDLNARPCDFQNLEMSVKQFCDQFNYLHYNLGNPPILSSDDPFTFDYTPCDNNPLSVLSEADTEFDEGFVDHWELWVEEEVIKAGSPSRWDCLISLDDI